MEMNLYALPEDCFAAVISFTSPRDACRISSVSTALRSAAESDSVWGRFLPPEVRTLVDQYSMSGLSKKELFLRLCDSPLLIDNGRMSFWLDKWTGKKCYMLSARELMITWADTPSYWRWTLMPEARFAEVAELLSVCWFEIRGRIRSSRLSEGTLYGAYLIFKRNVTYGFENQPVEVSFGPAESEVHKRTVFLERGKERRRQRTVLFIERGKEKARRYQMQAHHYGLVRLNQGSGGQTPFTDRVSKSQQQHVKERKDGWLEVELGEVFVKAGLEEDLEMNILETNGGNWKGGIIVQGIEIRPKEMIP